MNNRALSRLQVAATSAMAVLLFVVPAAATASHHGQGEHHNMPAFADIDLDGDGAIVASEFYAARAARMAERAKAGGKTKNAASAPTFESIDLDDNGEISAAEFAEHQEEMKARKQENRGKSK